MTPAAISDWLVTYVARELGVAPGQVGVETPLSELGLSSRQVVILGGDLEDWLGREIPDDAVWDHPSIRALSDFLGDAAG